MLSRLALIIFPLALLTACGPANTPAEPAPAVASGPAAPRAVPGLALDEYAVGPIVAQTPFKIEAIQALFPKDQVDGHAERITVTRDDTLLLEIRGQRDVAVVGEVRIAGRSATGPRGEVFGMAWPKLDVPLKRCWMGRDEDRHAVICTQPGEPVLRYVFEVPGWKSDAMPSREVLASATLRDFIWKSGAGGYVPAAGAGG